LVVHETTREGNGIAATSPAIHTGENILEHRGLLPGLEITTNRHSAIGAMSRGLAIA
jgi:hypothetical protein